MRHKVDPAALLVAVFAVGAGPLFQPGEWYYINSVTAAVVLLVVMVFSWPNREMLEDPAFNRRVRMAYAAVYAFVVGVGMAWPVQLVASIDSQDPRVTIGCNPVSAEDQLAYTRAWDCVNDARDALTARGTGGGMIIGLIVLATLYVVLTRKHESARKQLTKNAPVAPVKGSHDSSAECAPEHTGRDASPTPATVDTAVQSKAPESAPPASS